MSQFPNVRLLPKGRLILTESKPFFQKLHLVLVTLSLSEDACIASDLFQSEFNIFSVLHI